MHNFCTLFDSNYLSRGLALHESLTRHSKAFHLYIFPFDQTAYDILHNLQLEHVTLVGLQDFENENLLRIKSTRSRGEYCWTCTASIISYCLAEFKLPSCTYLDSDLYFYADPAVLINEMGGKSILITEHRYSTAYDHARYSGIYCVQFICFKNDTAGLTALHWWRDRCIEWCFNRLEDGKFGDQKYLDDWTERFAGVHILQHLGGGLAPWNVQRFKIEKQGAVYTVSEGEMKRELVFYHFHWVKFLKSNKVDLGSYDLNFPFVAEIYRNWLIRILYYDQVLLDRFQFQVKETKEPLKVELKKQFEKLKRKMKKRYNVVDLKSLVNHG